MKSTWDIVRARIINGIGRCMQSNHLKENLFDLFLKYPKGRLITIVKMQSKTTIRVFWEKSM